jgi:Zn-dependent M28 family amino/carboxypeptidase
LLRRTVGIAAISTLLVGALIAPATAAGPVDRSQELRRAVTTEGVFDHLEKFQRIANRNANTRASGTPGYDDSADYVADKLAEAGYIVRRQSFDFVAYEEVTPSELQQVEPEEVAYEDGVHFDTMDYSGSGDVAAEVTAVDVQLGPDNTSTSGCEAADFADFPAGNIALIQRGTCTFSEKAFFAMEAGAVGVIIFNQGNTEDRTDLLLGTLGPDPDITIPVFGTTYELGATWVGIIDDTGLTLRMFAETTKTPGTTENVFGNTPGGRRSNMIIAGGHLDSVPEGPGINDNGSGTGALLEIALEMADLNIQPRNKVRFAFWGAEESGLLGSNYFVENASEDLLGRIAAYLNFDMIGSPNFARFIYDGNGSAFPDVGGGPPGSGAIERIFQRYFEAKGLATSQTEFSGRSDYQAFILAGIPAGGLFTGAEGIKTEQEAELYGGTAGEAYDPCYHQACDDIDNVSKRALGQMSDAVAHAIFTLAMSTKSVNGVE